MGEHLGTPGAAGIGQYINDTLKGMDSVQSESPQVCFHLCCSRIVFVQLMHYNFSHSSIKTGRTDNCTDFSKRKSSFSGLSMESSY